MSSCNVQTVSIFWTYVVYFLYLMQQALIIVFISLKIAVHAFVQIIFYFQMGPVVKLCMGIEPAFYVDAGPPTFAFSPCGHMATEKTVK